MLSSTLGNARQPETANAALRDPTPAPLPAPPAPPAPPRTDDQIAEQVGNLINTDLNEPQMRAVLARTSLTEAERRIVVREVLAARAHVDDFESRRRAGWL